MDPFFNTADNSGKFVCTVCEASYIQKSSLKRHLRDECGKLPKYACHEEYCGFRTKRRSNLKRHILSQHKSILTIS